MAGTAARRLTGEERRAQIIESARAEFLARGFSGSRIQNVADGAGINIGLLYRHFESKDDLFEAAIVRPLHELVQARIAEIRTMPIDANGGAQLETTRRFVLTLLETFYDSVTALGVVLFGEQEVGQQFYARHVRPLIEAAVEASVETLPRWPHRDFDIRLVMQGVFGMAFWVALDAAMTGERRDPETVAAQLADIVFNGMRAR